MVSVALDLDDDPPASIDEVDSTDPLAVAQVDLSFVAGHSGPFE